jgi:hypothetical protein
MRQVVFFKRLAWMVVLSVVLDHSFAAFVGKSTGLTGEENKLTLKTTRSYHHNRIAPSLRLAQFQYSNSKELTLKRVGNQLEMPSMIRLQSGNTAYVYRYQYRVKKPLFVQPTPPPSR